MSITKRKLKNNFFAQIKIFISVFLGVVLVFLIIYFSFLLFFPKKNQFVSPLWQNGGFKNNQIEQLLDKENIPFLSVEKKPDSFYEITLKDGGKVLLSQNKNVQNQISSLQLILSRLTIEGKRFKNLDFRYDKPVIEF